MLKLEEKRFELDGQTYTLRCNMAVLERVEDAHGDMEAVMNIPVRQAEVEYLAAMLNDDAEERGIHVIWTPDALKRKLSYAMLKELDIMGMVYRAISPADATGPMAEADTAPDNSGN